MRCRNDFAQMSFEKTRVATQFFDKRTKWTWKWSEIDWSFRYCDECIWWVSKKTRFTFCVSIEVLSFGVTETCANEKTKPRCLRPLTLHWGSTTGHFTGHFMVWKGKSFPLRDALNICIFFLNSDSAIIYFLANHIPLVLKCAAKNWKSVDLVLVFLPTWNVVSESWCNDSKHS